MIIKVERVVAGHLHEWCFEYTQRRHASVLVEYFVKIRHSAAERWRERWHWRAFGPQVSNTPPDGIYWDRLVEQEACGRFMKDLYATKGVEEHERTLSHSV